MFGTLINDVEHKESLTFVENTDPASALSLSRREKPHTSCKFCRARKIRCSGQPTGCDRCVAVGAECQYPGREPRRRKTQPSVSTASSTARRNDEFSTPNIKKSPNETIARPQTADAATHTLGSSHNFLPTHHHHNETTIANQHEATTTTGNHQIEQWLSGSSNGNGGLDEWLDFDMLTTTPLSQLNERMEIVGEDTVMGGMAGMVREGDVMTDLDFDSSTSSTIPSPTSLPPHHRDLLSSPLSPPPLRHQPTSGSNPPSSASTTSSRLPRTTSSTPSTKDTTCTCLHLAARLLEDLTTETTASDTHALDRLLSCFRRSLVHCSTILECTSCAGMSECSMLLAMAGTYMAGVCERIVGAYIALRGRGRGAGESMSPGTVTSGSSDAEGSAGSVGSDGGGGLSPAMGVGFAAVSMGQDMWFSGYRIESAGERLQVLRCLVKVQMSEFAWVLEKMKVRAGARKGHLALVLEAEKRFAEVRRMVRRRGEGMS